MMIPSAYAQLDLQTIKHRDLVIDLGNGVKTNDQVTLPAVGDGPFPGVLLVHGSGHVDMNEIIHGGDSNKIAKPFWQIAQFLSERGFEILSYDKRGVGANSTIVDKNVFRNATVHDLIHDAEKALNVLLEQPNIDPKRISIIGHSEGTMIAPRVAIENPTKVNNIIPMGAVAQNLRDILYYQTIGNSLLFFEKVLDHSHNGLLSLE